MPSWKKIIVSGSDAELNQLTATSFGGNVSGSSSSTGSFGRVDLLSNGSLRINQGGRGDEGTSNNNGITLFQSTTFTGNLTTTANIFSRIFDDNKLVLANHFNNAGGGISLRTMAGGSQTTAIDIAGNTGITTIKKGLVVQDSATINTDLIVTGSISGSSTSTGSFGHLKIKNTDVIGTTNGIAIGGGANFASPSLAFEVTKQIDNNYVALFRNLEADAGRNFGLYVRAGTNTSDFALQIRNKDDSLLTRVDGTGNLLLNAGDVRLTSGNVSGSSTSTGSFGHLVLGNRDTDASFEFGRAHIGHIGFSDMAGFSHVDNDGSTSFALAQNSSGKTIVNAANGQQIALKINNADKVSIDATGLGIGTDTPDELLHLKQTGNDFTTIQLESTNGGTGAGSQIDMNFNGAHFYFINHGTGRTATRYGTTVAGFGEILAQDSNYGLLIGTGTKNKPIIFGTNNAEVMRIEDGNVKITGDITAENFIVSSSVTSITYQSLSGSTIFGDDIDDTHQFTGSLSTSGSLRVVGDVLIGSGSAPVSPGITSGQVDLLVRPNVAVGDYTTRLVVEQPNSHTYKSDAEIHVHGHNDGRLYIGGNRQRKIIFKTNAVDDAAAEAWTIGTPDDSTNFQISALNSTVQAILINKTSGDITAVGNISSSAASTGSFGKLLGDGSSLTGITSFAGSAGTETSFSGSAASTGSFGRVSTGKVRASQLRLSKNDTEASDTTLTMTDFGGGNLLTIANGSRSLKFDGRNNQSVGGLYFDNNNTGMLGSKSSTSTVPGLKFKGDEDTGIGRADADQLSLIAGGVEAFRVTSTLISGSATSTGSFGKLQVGSATIQIPSNGFITMGSEEGMVKNTRFGVNAGANLESGGTQNVLIGEEAGAALTTGDKNVVMGVEALKTATGDSTNVAIGHRALKTLNSNTVAGNVAIGVGAGEDLATGTFNVLIGNNAETQANDDTRSIVIGAADTVGLGDNTTVIGDSTQTLVFFGGDALISGSAASTGSFGHLMVGGGNFTSASLASAIAGGGGSGISNVVEDTSPQLGGDLDLNSNDITGTGNINIAGNLTVLGTTSTISTTNIKIGDPFGFFATGSAGTNVDGGIIIQSGSAVDSGSAMYHDISTERWSVAKGIASTATTVTDSEWQGYVATVFTSSGSPVGESPKYGVGEIHIDENGDIFIYS